MSSDKIIIYRISIIPGTRLDAHNIHTYEVKRVFFVTERSDFILDYFKIVLDGWVTFVLYYN